MKRGSPEWRAAQSERVKAYWARKHAEQAAQEGSVEITDYKKLYFEAQAKVNQLQNKVTEYENICKSYATQAQAAHEDLKKATIEYDARIKYMLDCAKHSYISMQFAAENKGGKQ